MAAPEAKAKRKHRKPERKEVAKVALKKVEAAELPEAGAVQLER
jgi:hypothetical protein